MKSGGSCRFDGPAGLRFALAAWHSSLRSRAPHEHRWHLADSEELVTFWILTVLDGKRVDFFNWQRWWKLPVLEEGSCRILPPGPGGTGVWFLDIWIRSVACPCPHTGFHT